MVAKITVPKSINAALNYNEKKVQRGVAVCLHAGNYLADAGEMNFYQKLSGFERLNSLNERATTKTLHVSLNFDPTEKLAENKLVKIAADYMERIGFGQQPYLVYKHADAGHPHVHIVSTTIQQGGSRINTHNIGRNQSEKARKEIELTYGLVKAERQQKLFTATIKPVDVEKVTYGKSETRRSIANVVGVVFSQYKFSSLPEFNAALKQFNVVADRGKEEGRIFKNRGLVYRILDSKGNKVGVPIKASAIGCKPLLDTMEKKFATNEAAKEGFKDRIKNAVDDCLQSSHNNMTNLITALKQKQIYTVLRQNAEGRLYGITFVDNQNKVVFNGSELGKGYSAAALQTRLSTVSEKLNRANEIKGDHSTAVAGKNLEPYKHQEKTHLLTAKNESLLNVLLSVKEQYDNVPNSLLQKKRKKKRKPIN